MDSPKVIPDIKCERCNTQWKVEELNMKMGGLLCPDCRIILVGPHNPIFKMEMLRRRTIKNNQGDL